MSILCELFSLVRRYWLKGKRLTWYWYILILDELTGVSSLVSLQMGALGVHLIATSHVASVNFASLQRIAAIIVHC